MYRILILPLALGLLLGLAPLAPAQDDARAILDKALKAHGGADKLAQLKDKGVQQKAKGTLHHPAVGDIEFTMENAVQMPNKLKIVMQMSIGGMNITSTQVYDGEHFWLNVNGMSLDQLIDDKALAEIKEQIYLERIVGLAFLKDKGAELSPLGEGQVAGKPAVGVKVASPGHRDVNLWFDKATGLLAKIENRVVDFQTKQEKSQEKLLSEYKEVDGYRRPTKVVINQDDKKFMDVEITDVKIVDKIDDSEFTKP